MRFFSATPLQEPANNFLDYRRTAYDLYRQRRFNEALSYIEQYLQVKPNNVKALLLKVVCLMGLHNWQAADSVLDYILQNIGHRMQAQSKLGLLAFKSYVHISAGDLLEAIKDINTAIELMPFDIRLKELRLRLYLASDQVAQAIVAVGELLNYTPNNTSLLNQRGILYCGLQQWEQALADFDKALTITPNYEILLTNKAGVMFFNQRLDECLELLNQAVSHAPNSSMARWMRANVLYCLERFVEAESDYCFIYQPCSQDSGFLHEYAKCLHKLGRDNEALAKTSYILALNANSRVSYYDLTEVYVLHTELLFKLEEYEQALVSSRRLLDLKPNVPNLHVNHACILGILQQAEEAKDYARWALALDPKNQRAQFLLQNLANQEYVVEDYTFTGQQYRM
jgi:tetratricopeptide (TPR) repeat protein